jgi:exodeoxyribonuclease VII large subunit
MTNERSILSVSELNQLADDLLRANFGAVWVEGEVSNLRSYASGHRYFSLKDDKASVSCTLFRSQARNASTFADGDQVLALGQTGVYAARGQFQLIVERLEPAGEGRLLAEFQRLKARLLAEGLFAPERKRALPSPLHRIGVITSPQGDVRHDIARTLARRFPLLLPFRLYPVPVQGAAAAPQIVRALEQAGREAAVDVLILARGGGSLEDLWAFNEETVARAIAACPIPVVTGIGHETDTTIADHVADLRASTPTAAAEAVSPDGAALRRYLADCRVRVRRALDSQVVARRNLLAQARARLQRVRPGRLVEQHLLRVDELRGRLYRGTRRQTERQQTRLRQLILALRVQSPVHRIQIAKARLQQQRHRLIQTNPGRRLGPLRDRLRSDRGRMQRELRRRLQQERSRLAAATGRLRAMDPEAVLQRGYSILMTADQRVIRSADPELANARLRARLADGELDLRVLEIRPVRKT